MTKVTAAESSFPSRLHLPAVVAERTVGPQASEGVSSAYAVDRLLRPMLRPAYRLAYMLLRDREAAEDAVQDAAVKSWRKLATLRPGSDPRPWFMGFVANECRNIRRNRWRNVIRLGERTDIAAKPAGGPNVDLQRALERLSDKDRLIVLLHFYLDMTLEEMAAATGWRQAAIRSRLYRALKRLKPQLEDKESSDG